MNAYYRDTQEENFDGKGRAKGKQICMSSNIMFAFCLLLRLYLLSGHHRSFVSKNTNIINSL